MSTRFRITNEQTAAAIRARRQREWARQAVERRIQKVDRLIVECEELNLAGAKRVPCAMESRLREVAVECPSSASEMHAGVTISRLLDELFSLQEGLLARRIDRSVYPDDAE